MSLDPRSAVRIMGTAVLIDTPGRPRSHPAIDRALTHLRWVEGLFSTFRPDSQISMINDGRLHVHDAHQAVREALAECARLSVVTERAFDHLAPGHIDPAGFVKGWAVDGAADLLRDAGFENFMIWVGGDVVADGHPEDARAWSIGIRDPGDPSLAVDAVELDGGAIATSGRYERGDHIWGTGDDGLASVSVIGPRLGTADALATAVHAVGLGRIGWFGEFPDYELITLTDDRRVLRTSPRTAVL